LQGGASSWVAVTLLLFKPFPFAGKLNPGTSTDFLSYLLGLPSAGPGQAGLLPQCCRQGKHQRANKITAPHSLLAITCLTVLMIPVRKVIPNGTRDFCSRAAFLCRKGSLALGYSLSQLLGKEQREGLM